MKGKGYVKNNKKFKYIKGFNKVQEGSKRSPSETRGWEALGKCEEVLQGKGDEFMLFTVREFRYVQNRHKAILKG